MAKGQTHYCLLVLEAARGQVKLNDVPNCIYYFMYFYINPLNAELNPICHLLALLGSHHIIHVSGVRFKCLI
jgi:hypothetical protein